MLFDKSDKPELPPGPRAPRCAMRDVKGVLMYRSREDARGGSCGEFECDPRDVELAIAAGWKQVE